MYFDGRSKTCPICGGRIIHPYTGLVTSEQLKEESSSCIWIECVDEGGGTIGYNPCCKGIKEQTNEK